ncbi:MAG: GuaB1 family IMP dehydrogenase-related protein [Candidatus Absconditabacterales bacterium]|nr:GuaB1 family IMP dehydrogenase-related protein [Candidatus Absconditabacterales bacterium]
MKFNNSIYENEELTYQDVFLFQNYFEGRSRFEIDVKPTNSFGTEIPIVVANMNAIAGKRMAETIARYGGLAVLPQDMSIETLESVIKHVKNANSKYDTPITVKSDNTIRDAMGIIHKRDHNCVVMVDDNFKAIGIFTPKDFEDLDQFSLLGNIKKGQLVTGEVGISNEDAFNIMDKKNISSLPIVDKNGILKGILTKKNTIRNSIYRPSLDKSGKLNVAVAIGINSFEEKIHKLFELGINVFVLDTAHGYQKSMIENIKKFRKLFGNGPILIAGNVITEEATRELIQAGANGVKVGIGPGAMCTTRMKTGVGRPQFTAVYKCAKEAKKHGGFVWADGGIKSPRDMNLALAAGANHVMLGSLFAGTLESVGDIKYDNDGNMYKDNYGMASKKAVNLRNQNSSKFELLKKEMFREGISNSKIYIKKGRESAGDIVDDFMAGLRSAMTYVGANNLKEFNKKAIIGVQTNAGFSEGEPVAKMR